MIDKFRLLSVLYKQIIFVCIFEITTFSFSPDNKLPQARRRWFRQEWDMRSCVRMRFLRNAPERPPQFGWAPQSFGLSVLLSGTGYTPPVSWNRRDLTSNTLPRPSQFSEPHSISPLSRFRPFLNRHFLNLLEKKEFVSQSSPRIHIHKSDSDPPLAEKTAWNGTYAIEVYIWIVTVWSAGATTAARLIKSDPSIFSSLYIIYSKSKRVFIRWACMTWKEGARWFQCRLFSLKQDFLRIK